MPGKKLLSIEDACDVSKQDWYVEIKSAIKYCEEDITKETVPKNADFFFLNSFKCVNEHLAYSHWKKRVNLTITQVCEIGISKAMKFVAKDFEPYSSKRWLEHFLYLMLPVSIIGKGKEVTVLADWLDQTRKPEAIDPFTKEHLNFLFLIFNRYRSKRFSNTVELLEKGLKSKNKEVVSAYSALAALDGDDPETLRTALVGLLEQHAKKVVSSLKKGDLPAKDVICRTASTLYNIGVQEGIELQDLPPEHLPFLVAGRK